MSEGLLDFLPLWAVLVCTVALTLVSLEIGFRIGRRRAAIADPENQSSAGAMAAASLALLAFLLAFSFQFAASRFEARRTILLDEVNAIGTTWLRARSDSRWSAPETSRRESADPSRSRSASGSPRARSGSALRPRSSWGSTCRR
jgi:hypothetical protein